ncbi:uncharacterized protein [Ptychodera flava]|uniref:uncharacterized protein n=1 Tax=Ptychodera flava TaxID=63121 RepID=UPI003969FF15
MRQIKVPDKTARDGCPTQSSQVTASRASTSDQTMGFTESRSRKSDSQNTAHCDLGQHLHTREDEPSRKRVKIDPGLDQFHLRSLTKDNISTASATPGNNVRKSRKRGLRAPVNSDDEDEGRYSVYQNSLSTMTDIGVSESDHDIRYKRWKANDSLKTFVHKTFRHVLYRRHRLAISRVNPIPDIPAFKWAELDEYITFALSDNRDLQSVESAMREFEAVFRYYQTFVDATGPLAVLLHHLEKGKEKIDRDTIAVQIKRSLALTGYAVATINHDRRKAVLSALGLQEELEHLATRPPLSGDQLFGEDAVDKIIETYDCEKDIQNLQDILSFGDKTSGQTGKAFYKRGDRQQAEFEGGGYAPSGGGQFRTFYPSRSSSRGRRRGGRYQSGSVGRGKQKPAYQE